VFACPSAQLPRNFAQFPVVVILAGEFFERGATARIPGEDLAARDIVVVTVNYRLHLLGMT
jgi:carboxylesterase type B